MLSSVSTCHRRFQQWHGAAFKSNLQILAADLVQRGGREASIDASFSGPKRALDLVKRSAARGSSWQFTGRHGSCLRACGQRFTT